MSYTEFSKDELVVKGTVQSRMGTTEVFSTPITQRENSLLLYSGKTPMWAPFSAGEYNQVRIDVDPENIARSSKEGGIDGYGVEWIFVEVVGGAMVRPGAPKVTDISRWEEQVTIPDPDTWDWEGCYNRHKDSLSPDRLTYVSVPGCLFERLIAVMDFENAIVALIDEDQQEHVHRFFRTVTEVHKKFYRNCKKWFNADIVNFNDDWGSQRAEFFSVDTVREMLLPYVKELVEYVHSLGMYWDLHCCGFVESFVPLFIEAGMNSWGGQPLNDKYALKQKYGDSGFVFTDRPNCPADADEETMDKAVAEFMERSGRDNRVLVDITRMPPAMRAKMYEASRRNYDRMVAEGTAIL